MRSIHAKEASSAEKPGVGKPRTTQPPRRLVLDHLERRMMLDAAAAESTAIIRPLVVDGEPTESYRSVGVVDRDSSVPGFCTGTLISRQHVLTAAHCVDSKADGIIDSRYFHLSPHADAGQDGTAFRVAYVYVHPGYRFERENGKIVNPVNDVAVLELDRLVLDPVIKPTPLYRQPVLVGQTMTVVGYGQTVGSDGRLQDNGREKQVGVVVVDSISPTELSWEFDQPRESNTAPGDSGGPSFMLHENQLQVAGIHSKGTDPANEVGARSWDMRADTFAGWIDSIVQNDKKGPRVTIETTDVTQPGSAFHNIRVHYTDVHGIDDSRLQQDHLAVIGPNDIRLEPKLGLVIRNPDSTRLTVDYRVRGEGGSWKSSDNGLYRVVLNDGGLTDKLGNASDVSDLRTFRVRIPGDNTRPNASLNADGISRAGRATHRFQVEFTDNAAIEVSSLNNADILVSSMTGYSSVARLIAPDGGSDYAPVIATFEIDAPGGAWTAEDNGSYNVLLRGTVHDTSGNIAATGTLGSFSVNIDAADDEQGEHPGAEPIELNKIISGSIDVSGEVDWFKFAAVAGEDYEFEPTPITLQNKGSDRSSPNRNIALNLIHRNAETSIDTALTYEYSDLNNNMVWVQDKVVWTAPADGTYFLRVLAMLPGSTGTYEIRTAGPEVTVPQDTINPTAELNVSDVTSSGGSDHQFTVTYRDNEAVDVSSIAQDIHFVSPGIQIMMIRFAELTGVSETADSPSVTASYRIAAPGGSWDSSDNGVYRIHSLGTVEDTSGNRTAAQQLGSFEVRISNSLDLTAPTAELVTSDLRSGGGSTHRFEVIYRDNVAIDTDTIGNDDVYVYRSLDFIGYGQLEQTTPNADGSTTAAYTIAAPGGVWDQSDQGSYTVVMADGRWGGVEDVNGNEVPWSTLGQFNVNLQQPSSEIHGVKFNDLNRNGRRDSGEPGLAGWNVYADVNNNGQHDPEEPLATTDTNGRYALTDLDAGAYIVRVVRQETVGRIQQRGVPGATLAVPGKGFNPDAETKVVFDAGNGNIVEVPVQSVSPNQVEVRIPIILDGGSDKVYSGKVTVSVVQSSVGTSQMHAPHQFQIDPLPESPYAAGSVTTLTSQLMQQVFGRAVATARELEQQVPAVRLGQLSEALQSVVTAYSTLDAAITAAQSGWYSVYLGRFHGRDRFLDRDALVLADRISLATVGEPRLLSRTSATTLAFSDLDESERWLRDLLTETLDDWERMGKESFEKAAAAISGVLNPFGEALGRVGNSVGRAGNAAILNVTQILPAMLATVVGRAGSIAGADDELGRPKPAQFDGLFDFAKPFLERIRNGAQSLIGEISGLSSYFDQMVEAIEQLVSEFDPGRLDSFARNVRDHFDTSAPIPTPSPDGQQYRGSFSGSFNDHGFFGSFGGQLQLTITAGVDVTAKIAELLSKRLTEEAQSYEPGGQRSVTISNLQWTDWFADIPGRDRITGTIRSEGGTGLNSYRYVGSFDFVAEVPVVNFSVDTNAFASSLAEPFDGFQTADRWVPSYPGDGFHSVFLGADQVVGGIDFGSFQVGTEPAVEAGFDFQDGILTITGSSSADRIVAKAVRNGFRFTAGFGRRDVPRSSLRKVIVRALEGDDYVRLSVITKTVEVHGGDGDDTIIGGTHGDILVGDAGNDRLVGRRGNDLLLGGEGTDNIRGSAGRDLVVGGGINAAEIDNIELTDLLRDWRRARRPVDRSSFADQFSRLMTADNARDSLIGGEQPDLLIRDMFDRIVRRTKKDLVEIV